MSKCPYTWFKSLINPSITSTQPGEAAKALRVTVEKNGSTTVDVSLPAKSARWLIDVIPSDVILKIRQEGIPIDSIQSNLAENKNLPAQDIFTLVETHRSVRVWLE